MANLQCKIYLVVKTISTLNLIKIIANLRKYWVKRSKTITVQFLEDWGYMCRTYIRIYMIIYNYTELGLNTIDLVNKEIKDHHLPHMISLSLWAE